MRKTSGKTVNGGTEAGDNLIAGDNNGDNHHSDSDFTDKEPTSPAGAIGTKRPAAGNSKRRNASAKKPRRGGQYISKAQYDRTLGLGRDTIEGLEDLELEPADVFGGAIEEEGGGGATPVYSRTRAQARSSSAATPKTGTRVLESGKPQAESTALDKAATQVLSLICSTAHDAISPSGPGLTSGVSNLMTTILLGETPLRQAQADLFDSTHLPGSMSTLMAVARVCHQSEIVEAGLDLSYMVCTIHFAAHIQQYVFF